ncbi:hypothetical protein A2380_03740 [candidate division WWE3 bacterium RIFOXYB1_FULL_43_24]|uniref:Uncharacterized protein n=2 Tax=Katanobacteria TaxID=422282 RepID=A0A0G0YR28_UNCKA|nr:MAG: hypothetical protein UU92_C0003G0005 [candidate division WWE3 bacterium GW2011_GWA1_42_12]KKS34991.1 MAG: hypothetical protein UU97_C0003G0005 [candidate division WWE3 bacterium GW2011_GWD1_42_14]KKS39079.1 MAG: hypothetical protein UV00_C0004G0005 [candidate division WWE3 bacterium GW2011_GWF1_42_14]KKS40609.1 MAG: hypothetical protein UV03_C0004G0005 [candidate division WWE3 bacterium GW2011_GWE1_42_16]KKS65805.1 MAG: hypothetical protein UV35_C0032G0008 [candidate division WWE3 bacte
MYSYGFYLTTLINVGISLDMLLLLSVLLANSIPASKVQPLPHVPPFVEYIPEEEWEEFVGKVEKDKYKVGPKFVPIVPPEGGEPEKPKPEPKKPASADPDLTIVIEGVDNKFESSAFS